jgi:sulfotransferase
MGQNPNFYVTPTSGVLELLYGARANFSTSPEFKAQDSELMKKGFIHFCHYGLQGYYSGITDKPYVLDKSRGWGVHYNFLSTFIPEPKIICMIRDPRDIFASMEKNFRKNQHLDSGMVNHAEMMGTTTEKRIDMWANSQPVGLALERLEQIIKEGNDKKMLFIKYEDLTQNPEKELKKIYEFIGIEYFQHDFENVTQITKEDDSVYGIYGDHNIKNKIEFQKSNSNQILGEHASNWIKNRYSWFYNHFKY